MTCVPCPQFLAFTCGLLRGTLSTLGIKSLVTASVASLPTCESGVGWGNLPNPEVQWGLRALPPLPPLRVREAGPGLPSPTYRWEI